MHPCSHVLRMQFPEAVLREIKILRQLRFHVKKPHPNIIMLRNIVLHRQKGVLHDRLPPLPHLCSSQPCAGCGLVFRRS